ncbi:MAG: hypothetical protein WBO10_05220 [Pyrinomonadaceae bacterium]
MKKIVRSLAILMLMGAFVLISSAQTSSRETIKFAKGKTLATVSRTISGDAGVITFIVNAKKGQRLNFTVEGEGDLGISLSRAGKQDYEFESETGEPNEYMIVKTGEHFITVVNHGNAQSTITLRVNLK